MPSTHAQRQLLGRKPLDRSPRLDKGRLDKETDEGQTSNQQQVDSRAYSR